MTIFEMPIHHANGYTFPSQPIPRDRKSVSLEVAKSGVILRSTIAPKTEVARMLVDTGLIPDGILDNRKSVYLWLPKASDPEEGVDPILEAGLTSRTNYLGYSSYGVDKISVKGLAHICIDRPVVGGEIAFPESGSQVSVDANLFMSSRLRFGSAAVELT